MIKESIKQENKIFLNSCHLIFKGKRDKSTIIPGNVIIADRIISNNIVTTANNCKVHIFFSNAVRRLPK